MQNPIKRDTKSIGDFSELMVLLALTEAGYDVSIPFGENHRYDMIADKDGVLSRVQVKTGRLRDGAVLFNCCSSHTHRNGKSRSYVGEIDYFGVYCPELRSVYLLPIQDTARLNGTLRIRATRNLQSKRRMTVSLSGKLPV